MVGLNRFRRNTSLARLVLVSVLSVPFAVFAFAQAKPERQSKADKSAAAAQSAQPAATTSDSDAESSKPEEKAFKGMHYRLIGPFRGAGMRLGQTPPRERADEGRVNIPGLAQGTLKDGAPGAVGIQTEGTRLRASLSAAVERLRSL